MTGASSDYNLVPYTSKPFPQSFPTRLAALAAIHGLTAPDVARCSLLELGCASGGNIVPLALRFPRSRFRGVDLTERHVRDGQARVEALGLQNVRIEQGDIAALDLAGERFDYIVCHGVYSWVPLHVRDAILRICGENLSDTGVAYLSYNVYPGWQLRGVIRDMMLYHAGQGGDPKARIAKARWVLDKIAKFARAGSPYGDMLRDEAALLARTDDSYILGEFLERENTPCYFRDFAAAAESRGLAYLCEAELRQGIPEQINPEVGATLRVMSGNKLVPLEQYMDFFKGRSFRQSLLVRAAQAVNIKRSLSSERAKDLHVFGRFTCTDQPNGLRKFAVPGLGSFVTGHDAACRALQSVSDAYPATRSAAQLAREARGANAAAPILDAVFKAILLGLVDVSTVPLQAANAAGARPRAWPLSRLDGRERNAWTTGPTGTILQLDPARTELLPILDGTQDRAALKERLLAAADDGRIPVRFDFKDPNPTPEARRAALEKAADAWLDDALKNMIEAAILE